MRNILLGPALALGLLGCGSGQTRSQPAASAPPPPSHATQPAGGHAHAHGPGPGPGHAHGPGQMCPMMKMAGAHVVATDTADGVAVAFTTTGDPAELRAHARKMADMHNHMAGMHGGGAAHGGPGGGGMHGGPGGGAAHGGPGGGGMHGGPGGGGMHGGGMHGGMAMHMVPSRASVEDLPDGARLVLVPNDPSQLAALRAHVREHAAMMARGECPMMGPKPAAPR